MNIIIPMSGLGSRFANEGYKRIKPLLYVNDKLTALHYVIKMYKEIASSYTLVIRDDHVERWKSEIQEITSDVKADIVVINPQRKGPIWACMEAEDKIDNNTPLILSYCDFYMNWNSTGFRSFCKESECDGAVICYSGFHPHLIPEKNVYASCKYTGDKLEEIREKFSFSKNKQEGMHSAGAYYFKSGEIFKKYSRIQMSREDLCLNGEYYSSLTYVPMIENKLDVRIYSDLTHFCQWGTPQDFEDFLYYSEIFGNRKINSLNKGQ